MRKRPMCPTGKIGYRSPQQAHRMNDDIRERLKRARVLAVYRCDSCQSWHLGSGEQERIRIRLFKQQRNTLGELPLDPDEY